MDVRFMAGLARIEGSDVSGSALNEWEEEFVPARRQRYTLGDLDADFHPMTARAIALARRWMREKREGNARVSLVLVAAPEFLPDGSPDLNRTGCGVGKTHIARAIQWSHYMALDDGTPVAPAGRFYTAPELMATLGDVETKVNSLAPAGAWVQDDLVGRCPVVVIDDVGTEGTLPFVAAERQEQEIQSRYFRIINYCYEKDISLVLTANLTLPALRRRLGERCWSRLLQMCPAGMMLDMSGAPDYRKLAGGR